MPVYEYSCGACGLKFEKLLRSSATSADAIVELPRPASLTSALTVVAVFIGTGFGFASTLETSGGV